MTESPTKKPERTKVKAEQKAKAAAAAKGMQDEARKDLAAFERKREFEIPQAVPDKDGQLTKVVQLDCDAPGILGLFMDLGNPIRFDPTAGVGEAGILTDSAKLRKYLGHMCNVDLSDDEVLAGIGWDVLPAMRKVATDFFMLRLVLDTELGLGTGA